MISFLLICLFINFACSIPVKPDSNGIDGYPSQSRVRQRTPKRRRRNPGQAQEAQHPQDAADHVANQKDQSESNQNSGEGAGAGPSGNAFGDLPSGDVGNFNSGEAEASSSGSRDSPSHRRMSSGGRSRSLRPTRQNEDDGQLTDSFSRLDLQTTPQGQRGGRGRSLSPVRHVDEDRTPDGQIVPAFDPLGEAHAPIRVNANGNAERNGESPLPGVARNLNDYYSPEPVLTPGIGESDRYGRPQRSPEVEAPSGSRSTSSSKSLKRSKSDSDLSGIKAILF